MANNLTANKPAFCTARQTISFADAGFNGSNTTIIYGEPTVAGGTYTSWRPESPINSVTGFTAESGYLISPKVDMDKTDFLIPPFLEGVIGAVLIS